MNKLIIPFLIITTSLSAQQKATVDLKWKISDTLTYKTIMRDVIVENNKEQTDGDSISINMREMFEEMKKQFSDLKYETKLFPDRNGNIDIAMILKKDKADTTENLFSGMAKMNGNVVLRGKVSSEGELLSFFYKRDQNNLISILFELPTKPVAVGDEWRLDIDMIAMDQNFKADTLYKNNMVRFKDLKIVNGSKIAVIEYDLHQYVSGDFENGLMNIFSDDSTNKKTFMSMSHKAIAEFDLEKGYWILYDGIMDIETNFSLMGMGGNNRTEFKLILKE